MENMLRYLNTNTAKAIGQALGYLDPKFIPELVGNLNAATGTRMADAQNDNPDLMRVIMENMSPATAEALAEGLNRSADQNEDFLINLLVNLDDRTGAAVAEGLNNMAIGEGSSTFFEVLEVTFNGTQEHTLLAITGALESSQGRAFLDALLANLDTVALAQGINDGLDAAPSYFLRNNLAATDADMMARISGGPVMDLAAELLGINPNPPLLDASKVANVLNMGLQPLLEGILAELSGEGTAAEMAGLVAIDTSDPTVFDPDDYNFDPLMGINTRGIIQLEPAFSMLTDMMSDNDAMAQVIADAVNNSLDDDPTGGLMHNLGVKVRLRFYAMLLGIPIGLDVPGTGYIDGMYTGQFQGAAP